ncbi:MAG: hypothetical protein LJE94_07630 [Deltaproteobacteria bacterium]|nr:hypothetical protein [Deltaproteobacteria bacterium]
MAGTDDAAGKKAFAGRENASAFPIDKDASAGRRYGPDGVTAVEPGCAVCVRDSVPSAPCCINAAIKSLQDLIT